MATQFVGFSGPHDHTEMPANNPLSDGVSPDVSSGTYLRCRSLRRWTALFDPPHQLDATA